MHATSFIAEVRTVMPGYAALSGVKEESCRYGEWMLRVSGSY